MAATSEDSVELYGISGYATAEGPETSVGWVAFGRLKEKQREKSKRKQVRVINCDQTSASGIWLVTTHWSILWKRRHYRIMCRNFTHYEGHAPTQTRPTTHYLITALAPHQSNSFRPSRYVSLATKKSQSHHSQTGLSARLFFLFLSPIQNELQVCTHSYAFAKNGPVSV